MEIYRSLKRGGQEKVCHKNLAGLFSALHLATGRKNVGVVGVGKPRAQIIRSHEMQVKLKQQLEIVIVLCESSCDVNDIVSLLINYEY